MATDKLITKAVHFYGAARFEIDRETVRIYENGDEHPVRDGARSVNVASADLGAAPLPGGPATVSTYDELWALLVRCGEGFAEKDKTARELRQKATDEIHRLAAEARKAQIKADEAAKAHRAP